MKTKAMKAKRNMSVMVTIDASLIFSAGNITSPAVASFMVPGCGIDVIKLVHKGFFWAAMAFYSIVRAFP